MYSLFLLCNSSFPNVNFHSFYVFSILLSSLAIISLNSLSDKFLISILFNSSRELSFSFILGFFVTPFWLFAWVCFYVVGTSMIPSLDRVALNIGDCGIQWPSLPDLYALIMSLCVLCRSSCCNWLLIAIGPFMHRLNPQAGWQWASAFCLLEWVVTSKDPLPVKSETRDSFPLPLF